MHLLTPYGFCRARKYCPYEEEMRSMLLSAPEMIQVKAISVTPSRTTSSKAIPCEVVRIPVTDHNNFKKNKGAKIMSIEERTANANRRVAAAEQKSGKMNGLLRRRGGRTVAATISSVSWLPDISRTSGILNRELTSRTRPGLNPWRHSSTSCPPTMIWSRKFRNRLPSWCQKIQTGSGT